MRTIELAGSADRVDLTRHLRENATAYFPELIAEPGDVHAHLLRREHRRGSTVLFFSLLRGGLVREVVLKIPRGPRDAPSSPGSALDPPDRPRLTSVLPQENRVAFEYRALTQIHAHFRALDDPRFGAIRPLELIQECGAIVMERVQGPTLRAALEAAWLRPSEDPALVATLRNVGGWLRQYQSIDGPVGLQPRHTDRDGFQDFIGRTTSFLGRRLRDERFFDDVARRCAAAAACLPDSLPLGLGHGDFAPRNVILSPDGRIRALDTLARHRVPVYEDLGYMLARLRTQKLLLVSPQSRAMAERVGRYEAALLAGYFGDDPVPARIVRLYEFLAVLDFWSAAIVRHRRGVWGHARGALRLVLVNRLLRPRVHDLIQRVEDDDILSTDTVSPA